MEEEVLGKAYDARLMRRLLRYIRPYKAAVSFSLVLLLLNSLLQVIGPLLTALAVDRYLAPSTKITHTILDPFLSGNPWTGLGQISFLYILAVVLGMLCDFGEQYIMQWVGQKAMFDLRREIMAKLQRLDLAFYDHNPVGRLVTRMTTDVDALNELFSSGLLMILGDLLMLSFVVVAMLALSPGMTFFLLAVMPLVVLLTMVFRRAVQKSYRRIRVAIARINSYLQEHIGGITVLQLFNGEARSRREFASINRDNMEAYKDAIIAYGWFYPIAEFLGMLALALLLGYGGFRVRGGAYADRRGGGLLPIWPAILPPDSGSERKVQHHAIGHGSRRTRVQASGYARAHSIARAAGGFSAIVRRHRIRPRLVRLQGPGLGAHGCQLSHPARRNHRGGGPHRRRKNHHRQPAAPVLRGPARRHPHRRHRYPRVRSRKSAAKFRIVLQDPHLFTGTIAENIRLGTARHLRRRDRRGRRAASICSTSSRRLPEGFAQSVRERGAGYSTGQKQLINFARALAHNPRFLILDEATSSVDTETELRIREALTQHWSSAAHHRDRAPAIHHPARRSHHRHAQRQAARDRHAPGVARDARHLLEAYSCSIRIRSPEARAWQEPVSGD